MNSYWTFLQRRDFASPLVLYHTATQQLMPLLQVESEWLIEWISMLNNFYSACQKSSSAISHPSHTQQGPLSACHCSGAQLEAPTLCLSLRRVSSYTADAHTTLKWNLVCRLKSWKTVFSASVQRIMTDRQKENQKEQISLPHNLNIAFLR